MAYDASVSRTNPSCILFLIDQSISMQEPMRSPSGAETRKMDGVADVVNRILHSLVVRCTGGRGEVMPYYYVGLIGYGSTVGPVFAGKHAGADLVCVSDLAGAARVTTRVVETPEGKETIRSKSWFDPSSSGTTPMCEALRYAAKILGKFAEQYPNSHPPMVVNVTDGEATDGDPTADAEQLQNIRTSDGQVLLFNVHISRSNSNSIVFPSSESVLPNPLSRMLFRMSSLIPPKMSAVGKDVRIAISEGARGFAFNADLTCLTSLLEIGTRGTVLSSKPADNQAQAPAQPSPQVSSYAPASSSPPGASSGSQATTPASGTFAPAGTGNYQAAGQQNQQDASGTFKTVSDSVQSPQAGTGSIHNTGVNPLAGTGNIQSAEQNPQAGTGSHQNPNANPPTGTGSYQNPGVNPQAGTGSYQSSEAAPPAGTGSFQGATPPAGTGSFQNTGVNQSAATGSYPVGGEAADNQTRSGAQNAQSVTGAQRAINNLGPGDTLADKYLIEGMLGKGGMAIVWRARHSLMDRPVAIKMMLPEVLEEADSLQRFEREMKAASSLKHPNIVTIYDYGHTPEGLPYLVMDLLNGRSLDVILEEQGRLDPKRVVHIMTQMCDALAVAHSAKMIHRDIKPSNVMLENTVLQTDFVQLVDFGIAKLVDATSKSMKLTKTGEIFGSILYMSPEQCMGKPLDSRSDIYALGCVLYELLTGECPFQGSSVYQTLSNHVNGDPPSLAAQCLSADIPNAEQFEAVFRKAVEKLPSERYQSTLDMKKDLLALI